MIQTIRESYINSRALIAKLSKMIGFRSMKNENVFVLRIKKRPSPMKMGV